MSVEGVGRAFGWVGPEEQERQQRLAEYLTYQEAFKVTLSDSPVSAARSRSHEIFVLFCCQIHNAKTTLEEAHRQMLAGGGGSIDSLLVAWIRAYRAVEWYESELSSAIAEAVTKPFQDYLKPDSPVKPWHLFRQAPLPD